MRGRRVDASHPFDFDLLPRGGTYENDKGVDAEAVFELDKCTQQRGRPKAYSKVLCSSRVEIPPRQADLIRTGASVSATLHAKVV